MRDVRVEIRTAGGDGANRVDDGRRIGRLHAVAVGARRDRCKNVVVALVHRQDHDARGIRRRFEVARQRDPVFARQAEVDHRDVGKRGGHRVEAGDSVRRLGHHLDAGRAERRPQPRADQRMVLDQHGPNRAHTGAFGNETVKTDPCGSFGVNVTSPPDSSAIRRTMYNPKPVPPPASEVVEKRWNSAARVRSSIP